MQSTISVSFMNEKATIIKFQASESWVCEISDSKITILLFHKAYKLIS
jgi:hypothetical protein